jgi:hypothetical protein
VFSQADSQVFEGEQIKILDEPFNRLKFVGELKVVEMDMIAFGMMIIHEETFPSS